MLKISSDACSRWKGSKFTCNSQRVYKRIKVQSCIEILVRGCRPIPPNVGGRVAPQAPLLVGTPQTPYLLQTPLLKLARDRDEGDPNIPAIVSVFTNVLKCTYVLQF